jgi:hypothetical protein
MFDCKDFARKLLSKGAAILTPALMESRQKAWRNRPYPPILNESRIERIKHHLKYNFGKDPEAFGLPPAKPITIKIKVPTVDPIREARKAARKVFVEKQLVNMDNIIEEWRSKRRRARHELKNNKN